MDHNPSKSNIQSSSQEIPLLTEPKVSLSCSHEPATGP
jgi:hypothetical protein